MNTGSLITLLSSVRQPARLRYIASSAWFSTRADRRRCPNCGGAEFDLVKRKYVFTALGRCRHCRILYRTPTDSPGLNNAFYQNTYSSGFTTDCPSPELLAQLKGTAFRGSPKDFAGWISLLQALGIQPGQRVLDFGASWGYGVWQLVQAGYDVMGFEISRPRARYAREMLGVSVLENLGDIRGPFDAVFACHLLEHVPRPSQIFEWLPQVLRPGGLLVALTPNGSMECMETNPERYHRGWGQVHPFYLDKEFYNASFSSRPKLLASWPYDLKALSGWDRRSDCRLDLSGWELLCSVVF
jgi:2-polyprenyl-3-methyl-5-hydroxy-6-metoxy-1,4-benzoquinol methylase